ncbi:MAG: AMP-binding protein [Rhodospirillales bacterium]|nr:AMP-binding protein [Rhodospirillales bacterium]
MNLAHLLARAGRADGERPAVCVGSEVVADYRTLARRAAAIAAGLGRAFKLHPGDRVALVMRNCAAYVEALFACWHGGFTAVPINAKLHPRELAFILEHAGARICLVTSDLEPAVATAAKGLAELRGVIAVDGRAYAAAAACEPMAMVERAPDDLAWLFYTSGTTGRSKGAMLTHRNLLAMTTSYFIDVDSIDRNDAMLHPAPMSHGSGLYILPHVAAAARQVIPPSGSFDAKELFALIAAHPGAAFFAAPTIVRRLIDSPAAASADTRNLKTIVYGGGPMYVEDCRRALGVLGNKLVQIYGQGESPMTITALSRARHADTAHPRYAQRLASVGVPHSVVEVMIADPDDRRLEPNEIGEVLVRGDPVMAGYWHDPNASAAALRGGWLHTGDVGAFDQDGFLTLKDRSKDLIISGGNNIYPREIEEVLLRHPGVSEVSVIGAPDRDWGEMVVAFVVERTFDTRDSVAGPRSESRDCKADPGALDRLCLDHLARFKRPKRYIFVDSLPKNNYGKVLKTALRKQLANPDGKDGHG